MKDYFQDITPPTGGPGRPAPLRPQQSYAPPAPHIDADEEEQTVPINTAEPPRGIRSIAPSRARIDLESRGPSVSARPPMPPAPPKTHGKISRWWLWGVAAVLVLVVLALAFLAMRPTTVIVTPRSHALALTSANQFTAYPAASATAGTLAYNVQTLDLQESAVVPMSSSTPSAPTKASGSITVYNSYSAASVKLVKNTRFASPAGLIFRVPADVVVPGMKGTTPGKVQVTVIADQPGDQYNIAATSRFTVPGLKSSAKMYQSIYASSASPMTGGSSGSSGPGVAADTLASTVASLQSKLQDEAQTSALAQVSATSTVLPGLMQITFANDPNTPEAGGNVRIHESAHVAIPVFDSVALGEAVGSATAASSDTEPMTITPGSGFAAQLSGTTPSLGTDPITFTLTGQAELIWSVDQSALASALAGRDSGAFQTIVNTFPGIQEAHAKVEPFWRNTFPSNPADIHITVNAPKSSS